MKLEIIRSIRQWFVVMAGMAIVWFSMTPAMAALPFVVKQEHPRIYISPAKVDEIRAAASAALPLNQAGFPVRGTLVFDLYPVAKAAGAGDYLGIFDAIDGARDHIFLRHLDTKTSGNLLGMQLALQSPRYPNSYIATYTFTLAANTWHTLRISWDSVAQTVQVQVDGAAPVTPAWKSVNGVKVNWQPVNQNFVFTGRDRIDNVRLYDSFDWRAGALLAEFLMNEGSGATVADSSGNAYTARISTGTAWEPRVAGGSDWALRMDGKTGVFAVAPQSLLTEAWRGFYEDALSVAEQLNSGLAPTDVTYGSPQTIKGISRLLGLAWLVTGDTRFHSAALQYASRLLAVSPRSLGGDYTQAGRIEAMGILYDWMYAEMGAATHALSGLLYRDALAVAIMDTISYQQGFICGSSRTITADWNCSALPANPDFISGHAFVNNMQVTAALLAIIDEHPELERLLQVEYENFVNGFNPARAWISVDGGHHMGWYYGASYTVLDPIRLWGSATNLSMAADWQGRLVNRYIYGLRGDLSFPASGDAFDNGFTLEHEWLAAFALRAGSEFGNGQAQRFYDDWIRPRKTGDYFSELIYWQPGVASAPIEALDYSYLFRNAGQVLMRDTWDFPKATLLEFKSASFWSQNHHHLDQNAFTLFYKAPLLVDSGNYDEYASAHWHNYFTRSIAHNTVTVWDPQELFVRLGTTACCSNDGGQQFMTNAAPTLEDIQPGGSNALDGVVAYEYHPAFTYTRGNASKAYSAAKLDQDNGFLRSLVFLRTPDFWSHPVTVVYDSLKAQPDKAGLAKRFLLHTVNEPEPLGGQAIGPGQYLMSGNTVTVRNGGGMLFAQTLLPENPVLTKIGGKDASGDYRFMAPVRDSAGNVALKNFAPSPDPGTADTDMGNWRIEVGAPVSTQREDFLHVLSVADDGAAFAPPVSENLSSATAAVALLGGSQLVAFARGDTPATNLGWDMPGAAPRMIVAGLIPNAAYVGNVVVTESTTRPYHVVLREDTSGSLRASAQGVLVIDQALPMGVDVGIAMSATPTQLQVGATALFTLTITNHGSETANGVTVTDVLPAAIAYVGAGASQGSCAGGQTLSCNLGSLASGASATVNLQGRVLANGGLTNMATVSVAGTDPLSTNNTASVTIQAGTMADLALAMTESADPVMTEQALSYTVTVTNQGGSGATGVVVTQKLPTGVTGSAVPSQGSCTGSGTFTCALGNLGNGQSASVTVTTTPGAEALFDATASGTFNLAVNATASVSAAEPDPNTANNAATATTTVRLACQGKLVTKRGTGGNDGTSSKRFAGGTGADVIHTLSGADWIDGKAGNDTICGGTGNDNLLGNGGNDVLSGSGGSDSCNGGTGTDSADGSCETLLGMP